MYILNISINMITRVGRCSLIKRGNHSIVNSVFYAASWLKLCLMLLRWAIWPLELLFFSLLFTAQEAMKKLCQICDFNIYTIKLINRENIYGRGKYGCMHVYIHVFCPLSHLKYMSIRSSHWSSHWVPINIYTSHRVRNSGRDYWALL